MMPVLMIVLVGLASINVGLTGFHVVDNIPIQTS